MNNLDAFRAAHAQEHQKNQLRQTLIEKGVVASYSAPWAQVKRLGQTETIPLKPISGYTPLANDVVEIVRLYGELTGAYIRKV